MSKNTQSGYNHNRNLIKKKHVCKTDVWQERVQKSPLIGHVEEKTLEIEYEAELSSITGQLDRNKYLDKYKEAKDDGWEVITRNIFSPKGWER